MRENNKWAEDNSRNTNLSPNQEITSESIKNAHASGDGSINRSEETLMTEEHAPIEWREGMGEENY